MTLKIYQQKRNFKKTPEPKGTSRKSKNNKNLYIIQKHAASHLHYDFRLELHGVLLSWAIPKGPSLDPSVKRLAMHVEDHPVEYGTFEGIIPKGEYGAGTVMLWDKGKWLSDAENALNAYKKGNLTFELYGQKLKGKWKLIRINNDNKTWLLIKVKDTFAKSIKKYDITTAEPLSILTKQTMEEITENYEQVWGKKTSIKKEKKNSINKKPSLLKIPILLPESSFPKMMKPQLATLVDNPPIGKNWLHEIKFDGYRLLIFKKSNKITIFTRNQHDWTHKFKTLVDAINKIPTENFILDGEVVVLDHNQHSDFQLLQNSIKENKSGFVYYAFDLLYFDKYNLTSLPLLERKRILQSLLENQKQNIIRFSDHIFGEGKKILTKSCTLGLEGIVSKDSTSPYTQGRHKNWLKTKCIKRQEFIIGGFNKSNKRRYFRSLLLGTFNKRKELIYHGNVGTGFSASSLQDIYKLLLKKQNNEMPFIKPPSGSKNAVWLKPEIVAEIEFTEWTKAGTLRHPSFKGIRKDKPAKNVIKEIETPIENIVTPQTKFTKPFSKKERISYPLTHPNKILYLEDKLTKQDIANYYDAIKDWIMPYIIKRPLTLVRCPNNYKECFYQKHIKAKLPIGVYSMMIKEKQTKNEYLYIKDKQGLMALPQLGVLEIHPWGCQIEEIEYPDIIVFDLDPAPNIAWRKVVKAAFQIKKILADYKLKSFVKTTGGKGLHIVIPIKPEYSWQEVKNFSHVLVDYLVMNHPDEYIGMMAKAKRENKIFIDYLRNQRGATAIAPYSTRARLHAPIAAPIAWDELTNKIEDTFFTLITMQKRLQNLKDDPWKDFFSTKQSLNLNKLR